MPASGEVNANGGMEISGSGSKFLNQRTLNWRGTATWTGGNIAMGSGAVFNNQAPGVFHAVHDANWTISFGGGAAVSFSNAGTFTKTGAGTTAFGISVPFNNTDLVNVASGTLAFAGGGTSAAPFNVASGAVLSFAGSIYTLADATLAGAGVFRACGATVMVIGMVGASNFELASGTLTGDGLLTVDGLLTWTGGTMSGTGIINANGMMHISGPAVKTFTGRTLNYEGLVANWDGTGDIEMGGGAAFNTRGDFSIHNDQSVFGGAGESFNNRGSFRKFDATGTTFVGVPFHNSGQVSVRRGAIRFALGLFNNAGGGISGSWTLFGNIANAGTLKPGDSTGTLNIVGNYTQSASGMLEVEIAETAAGQFDLLTVSGTATLAGTLNIILLNGFQPVVDDQFIMSSYGPLSGAFDTVNGTVIRGARSFEVDLGADRLTLITRGAPGVADIAVTKTHSPEFPGVGADLTYTVTVTNNGPDTAMGVTVGDALPANVTFVSATPSQGTCSGTSIVICDLDAIAAMANATVTIVVQPTAIGAITNNVTAAADQSDPARANNRAMDTTLVNPADLSVTKAAAPEPVQVGQDLTYTVVATNNGPNPATGVTLSDTLPASVTFISVSTTQGTCEQAEGTVSCSLGGLAVMGNATVTIVVQPTATGMITNSVTVSGTEPDQNTANNTATRDSTVIE